MLGVICALDVRILDKTCYEAVHDVPTITCSYIVDKLTNKRCHIFRASCHRIAEAMVLTLIISTFQKSKIKIRQSCVPLQPANRPQYHIQIQTGVHNYLHW